MTAFIALNRMLSVIFELRINWYPNKGQTCSFVNARNVVSLRFVAQRDSIGSVHKMILIISQQPNGTVLCYKNFLYRLVDYYQKSSILHPY